MYLVWDVGLSCVIWRLLVRVVVHLFEAMLAGLTMSTEHLVLYKKEPGQTNMAQTDPHRP